MLDLELYDRVWLSARPRMQALIADGYLRFDYRNVKIDVEGLEKIPDHPVIYAMNHTDNFNYWPFQYFLHRKWKRYMAAWVKGKNYEHPFVSWFMRTTNNIPLASRGYVITRDFLDVTGRRPKKDEYRLVRDAVESLDETLSGVPEELLTKPRTILGRPFDPSSEHYVVAIDELMNLLHGKFVELNRKALDIGADVLVFPQGTRSVRLSRGHVGLAQMALHLGATIVPVGCNNCDLVYSGKSIVTKPGHITYRIGDPIPPEHWGDAPRDVPPLTRAADQHRDAFQRVVDEVMDRINELLDERHRYSDDQVSEGTTGTERFV